MTRNTPGIASSGSSDNHGVNQTVDTHIWDDLDRSVGQMFMAGFDGADVTSQIKEVIEKYHVGSILLTAKNLISAAQTTRLVYDLQKIAHDAGHPVLFLEPLHLLSSFASNSPRFHC